VFAIQLVQGIAMCSICLHLAPLIYKLTKPTPSAAAAVMGMYFRYNQCLYDLIMCGKVCVVEEAMMHNLETMQFEPAAATTHQAAQAAALVPLLQLTKQQQELIPVAIELYYDLLAAIHQERQQINSQMTAVVDAVAADSAAEAAASASASADAAAGSLGSRVSCSKASCTRHASLDLPDRRVRLQQQEALTTRLNQLLHKEVRGTP
jgi:hypothetical protein